MNLSDEIRKQIEKNKGLKLEVGEINNHLSILEGLVRKDIMEQVDEAYQRGLEEGKAVREKGCEECEWDGTPFDACERCCNNYKNMWQAKSDKIEVGDEVADKDGDKTIVTNIHGDLFDGLCSDGSTMADLFLDDTRKTGRHFDIAKILEDMRND